MYYFCFWCNRKAITVYWTAVYCT
uniref:Uncharacterized protein n=1 Tax=Anguilla anguilla TaxID=7936 RepID=A0A0E9TWX1_ANGAN